MKGRPIGFVVLLRGINVGGNNRIPMSALRPLCAEIGCAGVQSYIQSGNLVSGGVARSKLTPALLDRLAGSPVTMRNWRTVLKLEEMVAQAAHPR